MRRETRGIMFGTIYAMSKYRNCSKDISLKKKMEQTEEYFINLLYKILLGIFIGGIGGIPIGVFFLDQKKYTFTIEPTVLIALITSTTASVLGIFICVMWWLFPRNVNKNADS